MSNAAAPEDVEKLSFEDALDELERITAEMASGNATLDQSVKSYERGAQLLKRCRAELNRARQSIERIRVEDGEVKRQTSDASASEAPIPSADTLNESCTTFYRRKPSCRRSRRPQPPNSSSNDG
ncbi:exodeoxyribonuclease VII small subunit [Sutterella wadsworthensis]|uniref:exodeoxyribonuclease VII small subunit n=1 Tax=Sutterella wadsworthensis TaxID=40545 RepID=UPI003076F97D